MCKIKKMKKSLFILLVILIGNKSVAQNSNSTVIINALDTIVFDIAQAQINGSYVEFPVSFLSDDTVYAVDFSFKYNYLNFTYDSILDLTNYLQQLSYYNPNDSIVRFTSYSLTRITNDTALAMIRFTPLSWQQFCLSDLNTIKAYLNGDGCSYKVIDCIPNAISDLENFTKEVRVYPIPAREILFIESPLGSTIELLNVNGKNIFSQNHPNKKQEIKIGTVANGIYLLRVFNDEFVVTQKVVINN